LIGDDLIRFDSEYAWDMLTDSTPPLGSSISTITCDDDSLVFGEFSDPDATDDLLFIVVNTSLDATSSKDITLTIGPPSGVWEVVDELEHRDGDVNLGAKWYHDADDSFTVSLAGCEGRLYRVRTLDSLAGTISTNLTISKNTLISGDVTINNGVTVTINPGINLLFPDLTSGRRKFEVYGELIADGTPEYPIVFTSSDASPAKSDWEGIQIYSTSDDAVTVIDNCIVEYSYYGIYVDGTSPDITNSTFQHNYRGMYLRYLGSDVTSNTVENNTRGVHNYISSPYYNNNVIRNNSVRGLYAYGASTPTFYQTTIDSNGGYGVYINSNVDAQFGVEEQSRGYNEIVDNTSYGIYANHYCEPFLGTSDPYGNQTGGSNSIHGNGTYNIRAIVDSHAEAEYNWWDGEEAFSFDGTSSVDNTPELGSAPSAAWLGSSLAKGASGLPLAGGTEVNDCPDYDFFNPDTNSQCGLWQWAHDLRITNQLPVALYAYKKYVEKYPDSEEAPRALVKIVNFSPEKERSEVIDYLKRVMQKHASIDVLRIKALELLVSEQTKYGDYPGAIVQALKLLAQAQNEEQEAIALLSLVDLQVSFMKNETAAQNYLQMLKSRFPNNELTMIAAELMGEDPNWSLVKEVHSEEDELVSLPKKYALHKAYPNPFNPITHIGYDLPEESQVVLSVYDVKGRLVKTLTEGFQNPGYYEVQWNGRSENGKALPSGLYIYRLQAGKYTANEKMLLLK